MINTVIQGDCLIEMKKIEDKSIDLILTDPPYGIGISKNPFRGKFEKSEWDNSIPTKEYFNEMFRISKNQIIWGGNYFTDFLFPSKCFYVWDKVQPENFSSAMIEQAWVSSDSPAKLFKRRVVSYKKYHPTTKPTELMEWCISFFPNAKTVLDPFAGSGTTAVACINTNRNYILIEKEPKYIDIINKRIAETKSKPKLL